jgi:flap endonuclease-1
MGILNIGKLLDSKCSVAINSRKLSVYACENKYLKFIVGIDLSIFLYKFLYNNNDHIEGLTRLILRLLVNNITPVFIFDGKPPSEKGDTIQGRKDKRDSISTKININKHCMTLKKDSYSDFKDDLLKLYELSEDEILSLYHKTEDELKIENCKLSKRVIRITMEHIESSKELFDLFGVKYIEAPCEAESLMAYLCKNNYIHACISEDTDILVNGGKLFLRNFNPDSDIITEYCLDGILECLELTHDQFIDMCILCGCDYTSKINGMGPISSYKMITKYKSIDSFLKNNTKYTIPENFDYVKARELFKNPISDDLFEQINKDFKMKQPEVDKLIDFLRIKSNINDIYINKIKTKLLSYYLKIEKVTSKIKVKRHLC